MCKKILAAVDGSTSSLAAFDGAMEVALAGKAELIVCTVADAWQIFDEHSDKNLTIEKWNERARAIAQEINDQAQSLARARGIKCSGKVLLEVPTANAIVNYAKAAGVDCIVMGTHGRTGLARSLYGSVAAEVLKKADCAVMTVRQPRAVPART